MAMQYLLMAGAVLGCVFGQSIVEQADDGSSGSIKFTTPNLSDEESHSPFMPDMLKCDACRVVALQLHSHFEKFNDIHKHFKYNLPESEVLDITERVCSGEDKIWDNYGFKEVNKVHRLSGPGLETADIPGIMQGGGQWPRRLMDMCEQYMGNIGEMEIYKVYKKNPKSRQQFEDFLCRGEGELGQCTRAEAEMKKQKKKEEL